MPEYIVMFDGANRTTYLARKFPNTSVYKRIAQGETGDLRELASALNGEVTEDAPAA